MCVFWWNVRVRPNRVFAFACIYPLVSSQKKIWQNGDFARRTIFSNFFWKLKIQLLALHPKHLAGNNSLWCILCHWPKMTALARRPQNHLWLPVFRSAMSSFTRLKKCGCSCMSFTSKSKNQNQKIKTNKNPKTAVQMRLFAR